MDAAFGRFSEDALRVAVMAPPFFPIPPDGYGGIERVISVLTEGLVGAGHDVTLFAPAGSQTSARLVTPLEKPPPLGDPTSITDELAHVSVAYAHASEFDVIHDHTGIGPPLAAVLHDGPPVVHTLHGPWTPAARRLFAILHEQIHLVAISEAQRAAFSDIHYAGVVANGVDLDHHPFRSEKEDFLVYVGRVSPEKRPEMAVDVARRAGLPLKMIVKCSEPAEQSYWDTVVAPVLGDDIEVFDQPPHELKVDLVGRATAMVFPIDWPEPFGLVMIEAMACGTPVIARPVGAAPEVVVDGVTGFLRWDERGMAEAVRRSADLDPGVCRDHVESRFSARSMVAGYESVYRQVTERKSSGISIAGAGLGRAHYS